MSKLGSKGRMAVLAVALSVLVIAPLAVVGADRFGDVPDSNVFHDDISWLADADVTRGCNPPANDRFCPSDTVTREQMAAFMHRLAENRVVDAATAERSEVAADAEMLEGKTANEIAGFVFGGGESASTLVTDDVVALTDVSTTVETVGFAVLTYSLYAAHSVGDFADVLVWLQLDDSSCIEDSALPGSRALATVAPEGTEPVYASIAKTTIVELDAGIHTVTLCVEVDEAAELRHPTLTGMFSAQGEINLAPAGASETGSSPRGR